MALSDLVVRQAKTTGTTYTLTDIDGLGLTVSTTGRKTWYWRYYWLGEQKRLKLGCYPAIGLRDARTLRDEARVLLDQGVDPYVAREQKRHQSKLDAERTFHMVFDAWVEHRRKELKDGRQSTLSQIQRIFKKDVLPRIGKIVHLRHPPSSASGRSAGHRETQGIHHG